MSLIGPIIGITIFTAAVLWCVYIVVEAIVLAVMSQTHKRDQ
jgi:hypothetical protein